MIQLTGSDQFRLPLDRNGIKIHIGEQALILTRNGFFKSQVIGFSENYKFVYLVSNELLYKRNPQNIVLVHNLKKWKKMI